MSTTASNSIEHRRSGAAQRIAIILAASLLGFAIAAAFDGWASHSLHTAAATHKDWGRALRVLGYLPLWLVVSVVFIVHDGRVPLRPPLRDRFSRGVLLALSSGMSGALAELFKLIIRRERPGIGDSLWSFRPFAVDTFSTSNLSMPSSHSAVAFGAVFMLCRLHPGAWPLWIGMGLGCGMQRVLAHAHFVSDVYAAAILGYACAAAFWALHIAKFRRDTSQ